MSTITPPSFLEDLKVGDENSLFDDSGFPHAVIVLALGNARYAAVNATTSGPDPMTVGLIACFKTEEDCTAFEYRYNLTGDPESKTFPEARDIALAKADQNIYGLGLQGQNGTEIIHWVR
jgi:hypothetical protein